MPRSKSISLCQVEREEDEDKEEGAYREAVSRVSRAIPLMAKLGARLARRNATVARLPLWSQLRETTLFFADTYDSDTLAWLNFDTEKAENYERTYHTQADMIDAMIQT
jgi:hypothetical protein